MRKVNQGVTLITETGDTLQQILHMIDTITQSACEISASVQQQQSEHHNMVAEVDEITYGAQHTMALNPRATDIARQLRQIAEELDAVTQNILL